MEKEPPTAVILGIVNEGGKKKKGDIISYLNKHGHKTYEVMGSYDFISELTGNTKELCDKIEKIRKYLGKDATTVTSIKIY
jgi:hypothetical protein